MFGSSRDVSGPFFTDSQRRSVIIGVAADAFVSEPVAERRGCGLFYEVRIEPEGELGVGADRIVTCIMVAWAVTIFVGMGCLVAMI